MNEIIKKENIKIEDMIYKIRGKQVMLDSDLAFLYECSNGTKDINKAVKRNSKKFPNDFYFQLTNEEISEVSRFQSGTLKGRGYNIKYLPYVFTEQGVAMLASVLHSEKAINMSINIMRTFVTMRHYIGNNLNILTNIESKVIEHDNSIKLLQESFNKFEKEKEINEIYFDGKIYDAYSKILDIFNEAKDELIIIDRYTDKSTLDMIKNLSCNVILITSEKTKLTNLDIDKYNETYNNLNIYYDDNFHDRYFIIDKNKVYHSGNSVNHIGYRKSSVDIINDKKVKDTVIKDAIEIMKEK